MIGEAIVAIIKAIAAATGKSESETRDEAIAALRTIKASPPRDMTVDAEAMRKAFGIGASDDDA